MKIISQLVTIILCLTVFSYSNAYHIKDSFIVDEHDQIIHIDGIHWSGFEKARFVDGAFHDVPFYALVQSSSPLQVGLIDLLIHPEKYQAVTTISKEDSVSFKSVRLPIQSYTLFDTTPNKYFRIDLTDSRNHHAGNGVFCKEWNKASCVAPLSLSESFYIIMHEFKKNNIKVLITFHQTRAHFTLDQYAKDIAILAKKIKTDQLENVLGIDLMNKPNQLYWFEMKDHQPSWISMIAVAARAIYENNPNLLLFVQGGSVEENGPVICLRRGAIPDERDVYTIQKNACGESVDQIHFQSSKGENFRPLLDEQAAKLGIAKVGPQLRTQLSKEIGDATIVDWLLGKEDDPNHVGAHIVFSPYIEGRNTGANAYRFDWNFGFLKKSGYAVVISTAMRTPTEITFFKYSVIPYLINNNMNHDLFYWTFQSNNEMDGLRVNNNTPALIREKEILLHDLFND